MRKSGAGQSKRAEQMYHDFRARETYNKVGGIGGGGAMYSEAEGRMLFGNFKCVPIQEKPGEDKKK